jgi:hypothetical protein
MKRPGDKRGKREEKGPKEDGTPDAPSALEHGVKMVVRACKLMEESAETLALGVFRDRSFSVEDWEHQRLT